MSADPSNDPMEFVRSFWGAMGFSLPGMVTPTFDVDELSKRINDLKAVEGWLKMNLTMLQMTIQGLEMQCVTLNTVRAMGDLASAATAPPAAAASTESSSDALAQAALWPWSMMQHLQDSLNAQRSDEGGKSAADSSEASKRSR